MPEATGKNTYYIRFFLFYKFNIKINILEEAAVKFEHRVKAKKKQQNNFITSSSYNPRQIAYEHKLQTNTK